MTIALPLHDWIERNNLLKKPTEAIYGYFQAHPTHYKAALLANHIFRAIAMAALIGAMPLSVGIPLCFAGSLAYRLTVETHCAYKFALPAFAGGVSLLIAAQAVNALASGAAFVSLCTYGVYIISTVSYDVDHRPR